MEHCSRVLSKALLVGFALLFGLALLLGACRPAHLSYPTAFAFAVAAAAIYALLQRVPRVSPSLWEQLGAFRAGLILLLFCFVINLAWVLCFRLDPTVDYLTYWNTALELASDQTLTNRSYVALFPHILGYSLFLSMFLRVFGDGALVAPILNVCLTTLSGYFLYRLLLRYRSLDCAALGLIGWSLFPSLLLYNTMVLSEPYYTCLLLAFLWICARVESERPALGKTVLLGLVSGLLLRLVNTARPIAAVPILALLIWVLLLRKERGRELRRLWLGFLTPLLLLYAVSGPVWTAFEERILGEAPASVPGYSFYVGLNQESLGSYSDADMDLLYHYRYEEADSGAEQAQRQMLEEASNRLHSEDFRPARLLVYKLRTFLGNDEGGAYYSLAGLSGKSYSLLAALSNICYYVLGILALWGVWRLFRSEEQRTLLLAPLYLVGLTLAQLLVEVAARYHYSVIPVLFLLAAFSRTRPLREKLAEGED